MHVEDYMNETPTCLLAMLTQTREDLWQAAKALTERGVTRIILTGSGTSYHGALTARSFMQQWCGLPVDVYWPFLLDDSALTRNGTRPGSRASYRFHGRGSASRYRPGGRFGLNSTLWRRAGWRQNQRVSLHHT